MRSNIQQRDKLEFDSAEKVSYNKSTKSIAELISMQIIQDRRNLHTIPELDRTLPKTIAYLTEALSPLGCQVFSPMEGALCAYFDFGASKAIAFRAEMDALPIKERTRLPFASQHKGIMHACGHDGHMAILLELARRLAQKEKLARNVLLVFQPSEETTGAARALCGTKVFKKYGAEAIFALHLWPGLDSGVVYSRKNEMMARSCEVRVEITGRATHITRADQGMDALAAGIDFYRRVMALEGALPKSVLRTLNFGKFQSGSACNVLSDSTVLEGSLRTFQDDIFYSLRAGITSAGKAVERASGCSVSVSMNEGYPTLINPTKLYDKVKEFAEFRELGQPCLITEDFAWYQQSLPGMFFFLGLGDTPALHAVNFDFDDSILAKGADFFEKLAENM